MYVVRIDSEDARQFQAFARLREARAFVRRFEADEEFEAGDALALFDVPDTFDAEIAVMAVRDGLGIPVLDPQPDAAVILASMGLGTGLRI